MVRIDLGINLGTIEVIDQIIEREKVEMTPDRSPKNIVNIVIRMSYLEIQSNVKKAKRLKGIDDRDGGPLDKFNSTISEDPVLMKIMMILSEISQR